jgi:transcriptional regulator GlxA family with amidase domain
VKIEIVVYPGFDELDAIGPFEVLRTAAEMGAAFETHLVAVEDTAEIIASHGLRLRPEKKLALNGRPDVLVIPGGGWSNRAAKGAWAQVQEGKLPKEIVRLKESGTTVASVCTGGMILASTGILRGRPAITHASAIDDLRAAGAKVMQARVVDDGDVITSGGVTSGLDMSLWLVERYAGEQLANSVAQEMEHERNRDIWRRSEQAAAERAHYLT